jgi:biotin synthase
MTSPGPELNDLVESAIERAGNGRPVSDPEVIAPLFETPLFSPEAAILQAAARDLSRRACKGRAEVHAQVALNTGPCPRNCLFCAFAHCNEVFTEQREADLEYVVDSCRQFESDGANAVFLMATGAYPFERFVERSAVVRQSLCPETPLVANIGDFTSGQAVELRRAGFDGVYHAVRIGEGEVTGIPVERRLATFAAARDAGLLLGTCLEPVGPEHSTAELVDKLLITRDARPVYSGSARRINIPGGPLEASGMVSEAYMALVLAVVRLILPLEVGGNCTHEPSVIGAAAGANLLWAEVGGNPRDTAERTEEGRGMTVAQCRQVLAEAEWQVLDGPSAFYRRPPRA